MKDNIVMGGKTSQVSQEAKQGSDQNSEISAGRGHGNTAEAEARIKEGQRKGGENSQDRLTNRLSKVLDVVTVILPKRRLPRKRDVAVEVTIAMLMTGNQRNMFLISR
jgi:hypothetical protein